MFEPEAFDTRADRLRDEIAELVVERAAGIATALAFSAGLLADQLD